MNRHRLNTSFGCLLFACLLCGAVLAQSGRHQPPPHTEAPVPTPTPEPPRVKPTPVPQVKVFVGTDQPTAVALSSTDVNIVADTVLRRLHESDSLSIQSDRMSRQQARKRARSEPDRFIVWFSLEVDPLATNGGVLRPSADELRIEDEVFQPGKGKAAQAGS